MNHALPASNLMIWWTQDLFGEPLVFIRILNDEGDKLYAKDYRLGPDCTPYDVSQFVQRETINRLREFLATIVT